MTFFVLATSAAFLAYSAAKATSRCPAALSGLVTSPSVKKMITLRASSRCLVVCNSVEAAVKASPILVYWVPVFPILVLPIAAVTSFMLPDKICSIGLLGSVAYDRNATLSVGRSCDTKV